MKTFDFTVVIWKEKAGYVSKCPELGVASCGGSISEAMSNLKEAVELYIENAKLLDMMDNIEEQLASEEKFISHLQVAYA